MQIIQTITCSCGRVRERTDGIIEIALIPDTEIGEKEAGEFLTILDFISARDHLILFDHRIPHCLSFKGMLKLKHAENIKSLALLAKDGINTDIALFIGKIITDYPVRVFHSKGACVNWLKMSSSKVIPTPQPEYGVVVK